MKNHQNVYRSLQATMGTVLLFFAILKITSCNSDEGAVGEPGTIQVNVSTSGIELDSDGYEIMLDGGTAMAVASTGLVTFDQWASHLYYGLSRRYSFPPYWRRCW